MNLASRLFIIVDERPVYGTVLINIKCFKDLYELDKSEDKNKYNQHMVYIWYTCDPSSPYFNAENAEYDAAIEVYGRPKKITKQLRKCMDEYIKRQSTPMIRAYKRAMRIADNSELMLQKNEDQSLEFDRMISDSNILLGTLGRNVDDMVSRIEIMKEIEDLQTKRIKRQGEITALIPKINTQVKDLINLKKEVDKDRLQIDSDENKEAISNFLIDKFIDKYS